jgi:hypothetical protein
LEQAWRKFGAILWCNSVIFGKNFSDGRILSAILLESRSKLSHLGRRVAIHSGALYLSEPKARSRAGDHVFMAGTEDIPINNGAVLNILQIIRAVMSSATEDKLRALFVNAKMAVSMQCTLKEVGHP